MYEQQKKTPHDGGYTLEQIKNLYPNAERIKKGYLELIPEEKQHITDWILRSGMKLFYPFAVLEAVLLIILFFIMIRDAKGQNILNGLIIIALSVGITSWIYVMLRNRNQRWLNFIHFDKIEEVLLISFSSSGNSNIAHFLRWDNDKKKYYEIRCKSNMYLLTNGNKLVYHPYGTDLFIPK